MAGNATYNKYKRENKELREKLALYESGIFNVDLEEHVVKVPESFEMIVEEERDKKAHYDDLSDIFNDVISEIPGVNVKWEFKSAFLVQRVYWAIWEALLRLGNGDASKGLDIFAMKYRNEMARNRDHEVD